MSCSLLPESDNAQLPSTSGPLGATLAGTLVSSLHRLKDTDNIDGAFFVFGDLSVKHEGNFRLQFSLYEMRPGECSYLKAVISSPFPVHSTKNFLGMSESTFLTRSFSDQGVRLRLRKEPRTLLRKRGPAHDDYEPRHYRAGNRQGEGMAERQATTLASEAHEDSKRNHPEQAEFNQIQSDSWDQRPSASRNYSHQSAVTFAGAGTSYDDYQTSKRPRTGSEQSHASIYSQTQSSVDSGPFTSRPFPEGQASSFNQYPGQQAAQHQNYGSYTYAQATHSAPSPRPNYYNDRNASQAVNGGSSSPFDSALAIRTPQEAHFPPQPQAVRYTTQLSHYGGTQPMTPSSPNYAAPNQFSMPPPLSRLTSNPIYPSYTSPSLSRRDSYQPFSNMNQSSNLPGGGLSGLYSQG